MGKARAKMDRLGLVLGFLAFSAFSAFAQVGTNNPFYPTPVSTQSLAATTTSSSVTFTGNSLNDTELYVYNAGTDLVFCRWGIGAQTATTAGLPIPSGTVQIFNRNSATVFACRSSTTTATVYVTTGNGQ
jgi:uncharacterized membrane protein